MSDRMQALHIPELNRVELTDLPRPAPEAGQILLRVHHSGVSVGTEMSLATGAIDYYQKPPFVPGYQAAGEIVEVGPEVEGLAVGDRVAAFCSKGSHAQYALAPAGLVHRLPEGVDSRVASLFVQPCVGANAINHADIKVGDVVLVNGQGVVGQTTAQLLRLRGAYVIATDVSPRRLDLAREHCADWVIDAGGSGRLSDIVRERFPGGVDVALESTGLEKLVDATAECVRGQGKFVFEGHYPRTLTFKFMSMHRGQLRAFFPAFIGDPPVREAVLRLMAGPLDLTPLISDVVPGHEALPTYEKLFTPERDSFNGIVFDWTGD